MTLRLGSRAAALAFLASHLIFFAGCTQKKAQAVFDDTVPVTVAKAIQKTVPVEVRTIGTVEAYSTVTVKSQVDGVIEKVHFQEGQDANARDLLFTIDPRPFEASLKQAEANLARDIAQAKNASAQSERYSSLFQAGIVSKEQYDQFRTNAEALEAAVRADRAAVERAHLELEYTTIRSPIDGRTGTLMVHAGNVVKANDTSLVVIHQVKPIYVDFSVPEQYLAEIKSAASRRKLSVRAIIPQEEKHPAEGMLTFVNNTVDNSTGTILLKAIFENRDNRLWPGQFVNAILTLGAQPGSTVVPSQAVQTGQAGPYVFVVKQDSTVELRSVTPGSATGGETVIEKGVKPGEVVVTDGQLRLVPGAKVEIKNKAEG